MKMSQVAKIMSVREFIDLCSVIDENRPGEKFNVARVERRADSLLVTIVFSKAEIMKVKLDRKTGEKKAA